MKKNMILLIPLCFALAISSCGKLHEKTIKVTDVKISGKVYCPNNNLLDDSTADYLKMMDGTYTMKTNGNKIDLEVEFKLIKEFAPDGALYNHNWWMSYVAPLDKAGKPLTAIISNGFALLGEEAEKVNQLLEGKAGDRVKVNLVWGGWPADVGIGKQTDHHGLGGNVLGQPHLRGQIVGIGSEGGGYFGHPRIGQKTYAGQKDA